MQPDLAAVVTHLDRLTTRRPRAGRLLGKALLGVAGLAVLVGAVWVNGGWPL